jgi:hypothetical protein
MDLPVQALSLYSIPEYELKRRASAKYTLNEMIKRLADGDFKDIYDSRNYEDSNESDGRPHKKRKPKMLSTSEEKFILNLNSCLLMHLGFYAPCNDDEWCCCPLLKLANKNWHEAMVFDSELGPQFCSSNKKFGPFDLVCHV